MARREFWINLDEADPTRALVKGLFDDSTPASPSFTRSDSFTGEFYCVRRNKVRGSDRLFNPVSVPNTLKVSMGVIDATPTGGTFTLTDTAGSQTTAAVAYNASAATLQTAIRAALTTNFSAATVTGDAGGPWTIDRGATGALANITGSAAALVPSGSTIGIVNTQDGNASLNEMWQVRLNKARPLVRTSGWTNTASAAVTVTLIQAGSSSANKVYEVSWNQNAYAGEVWLNVSTTGSNNQTVGPLPFNATEQEVVDALDRHTAIATTDVAVRQTDVGVYTITFIGTLDLDNAPTIATQANTLEVPIGLSGVLSVATAGADDILGTDNSETVVFEIEVSESASEPETIVQITDAVLRKDLIHNTAQQTTGSDSYVTLDDLYGLTSVFLPAVVGTTGGGSTKLDGQTSTDKPIPSLWGFVHATEGYRLYLLRSGTDAEDADRIIRPDDYAASTNERVYQSVL